MTYQPLHHKYRPQTFAGLVGQEAIATTLTNALRQQRIAPAYLFTGARGTGKTSSARILAKSLNCIKSTVPTEQPCGMCEVCRSIANGSGLDVIEIDAASNTGVDNIRELIERAQFAPVQCRYKVYVIDECLTGDSLVITDQGLMRIDDRRIVGKNVLSYSESSEQWEFKRAVRWLDQGERRTLIIGTTQGTIRCTDNHLIRTEAGWIAAKDVSAGVKILSPVSAGAAPSSTDLAPTGASADSLKDTSLREIPTDKNRTALPLFLKKLNHFVRSALADVVSYSKFPTSCRAKATASTVSYLTGSNILTNRNTDCGTNEPKTLSQNWETYHLPCWGLFTVPCWETVPSPIQINTVASQDCLGRMDDRSKGGWSTRQAAYQHYDQNLELHQIKATEWNPFAVVPPAILNLLKLPTSLNQREQKNPFLGNGLTVLLLKGLLGGIWMMDRSVLVPKEAHKFSFTPRATLLRKINSLLTGLQSWATQQKQRFSHVPTIDRTPTSLWEQRLPELGCQTSSGMQRPQWTTNLATVVSVRPGGIERVYDIEVEDNHNFVANGLLVHNCHMLSPAAFNALLKTLEEPPDRVVFVLATTDPQRVLPTIISRCQRFDFRRIPLDAMVQHLTTIAEKESISITQDAVTLVAQISQGGLRDAESLLDQLSLLAGEVTVEKVWDLVGSVPERDLLGLLKAIAEDSPEALLDSTRRLMDRGREPLIVLQNLASFYRDLLIAKTAPDRGDLVALTPPTWAALCQFAQPLNTTTILLGQQHLRSCELQLKNTTQPRLWLEVTLMGLLPSAISHPILPSALPRSVNTSNPVIATNSQATSKPTQMQNRTATPAQTELPAASPMPLNPSIVAQPNPPDVEETISDSEPDPSANDSTPLDLEVPIHQPTETAVELNQAWQEALKQLQPFSTQTLLRQQGCLLELTDQEARIGIIAQWFKTAKTKMINLEAAFGRSLDRKVQISLEIVSPDELKAARGQSASAAGATPAQPDSPPPPTQTQDPPANQLTSTPFQERPPDPTIDNSNAAPIETPAEAWQEDEVTRAAKRLAEFFAGKVVNMTDSPATLPITELAKSEAVLSESTDATATDVDGVNTSNAAWSEEEEDADDDDIPF